MWYNTGLIIRDCPMVSSNLPSGVFFNLFFIDFKALEKNDVISTKECLSFFIQTLINVLQQFRLDCLIKFCVQYKSLKVIQNGGKSKKSKTSFGASPVEDLDGFYQRPFPEERKSDFNFIQFRKCLPKFSGLHRCHDGLVVRVLGFS